MSKSSGLSVKPSFRSPQKPTSPLKSFQTLIQRQKSPNKRKSIESPSVRTPQKTDLCNNLVKSSANDCPLKFDDWIRFKYECEQKLLKFTEYVYREIWGKDWKKMLELDVNNTNLKEIIRVMKKEWFSNFSDHFNRDKAIKALVESIHTNLVKSGTNYHIYYKDLSQFVDLIERKLNELQRKGLKSRKTI